MSCGSWSSGPALATASAPLVENGLESTTEAEIDSAATRARRRRSPDLGADFVFSTLGQRHGVSLAPVATLADLLESPQLAARGFFRDVEVAGRRVTVPGPPYRFAGLDVGPQSSPARSPSG